ncbi:hypothetical protein ACFV6U_06835 [Streptomyces sp. NPDC059810]|uniref:hypothetical protein n=1 Tax=Streptomyces sp. NPDC059810 TaxID=3346956 RepID=UPI00365FD745
MFNEETALDLFAQGLLTELPASLITAVVTALAVWAFRRYRKRGNGGDDADRV